MVTRPQWHEEMVTLLIGDGQHWQGFFEEERRRRALLLLYQLERTMQAYHVEGWSDEPEALLDTLTATWLAMLKV